MLKVVSATLLGFALLAAATATAQDAASTATARELFEEGVGFVDQQRWEAAADRFGRALALYDSAAIRFNLARVQTELGRVVEAAEHLRNVVRRPDSTDEVRAAASEQLARIEGQIGRLRIHVEGQIDSVLRNGDPVPAAALDVGIAADPGTHVLVAQRDGRVVAREEVVLGPGETVVVVLQAVSLDVTATDPEPGAGPSPSTPIWEQWWLWTIVGVVVVGAGIAIGLGVALSQDDACTGPFMPCRLELP